ncbi:alpha/beta fold hydrolase [Streptomyces sp. MZ04]|uniref:alpha/beta fold hydrolase n=1 Tax=Streptomyces sp. MZ04 TaxID=2559236 RepID=UPI00107EE7F5|nr:alpha/beta fold hydrolase [Streptomyces sp. MZ04]TGB10793.1 alpha/beta fold hydrolase [Streptomyces sp. MZ04]
MRDVGSQDLMVVSGADVVVRADAHRSRTRFLEWTKDANAGFGSARLIHDLNDPGHFATNWPGRSEKAIRERVQSRPRLALGLDRVHILGHSWGSRLALEYVLGRPAGPAGLVLAGPIAGAPAYEAEARRLKDSLPPEVREVIDLAHLPSAEEPERFRQVVESFLEKVEGQDGDEARR